MSQASSLPSNAIKLQLRLAKLARMPDQPMDDFVERFAAALNDLAGNLPVAKTNSPSLGRALDDASVVAREFYAAARNSLEGTTGDIFYRYLPKKSVLQQWPYNTPVCIGVGLFRLPTTFGKSDGAYGLAVRIQTPVQIKERVLRDLRSFTERFTSQFGMTAVVKLIRAVEAKGPEIGGKIACHPGGDEPAVGSLTMFVKRAGHGDTFGLTAAHALHHPKTGTTLGAAVFCPFSPEIDLSKVAPIGTIAEIRPLIANPVGRSFNATDLRLDQSLDALLVRISQDELPGAAARKAIAAHDVTRLKPPIEIATMYDRPKRAKSLNAIKARSGFSGAAELRLNTINQSLDIYIPGVGARTATGVAEFTVVSGKIESGDSGALIVDASGAALGMLIATSPEAKLGDGKVEATCYAVPMTAIFKHMELAPA